MDCLRHKSPWILSSIFVLVNCISFIVSASFLDVRCCTFYMYKKKKRKVIAYDESTVDLSWPWDSINMVFCHAMYDVDFSGLLDLQRVTPCVYCH